MSRINLNDTILRADNLLSTELEDQIMLMGIDRGKYYGLDAVGSRIWTLMEQPVKVRDLCDSLCAEYSVSPQQCEQDVIGFLNKLYSEKMIKRESGPNIVGGSR